MQDKLVGDARIALPPNPIVQAGSPAHENELRPVDGHFASVIARSFQSANLLK
jgi:hypothetical protein